LVWSRSSFTSSCRSSTYDYVDDFSMYNKALIQIEVQEVMWYTLTR